MASVVDQPTIGVTEQDFKRRLIELGLLKRIQSDSSCPPARAEHDPIDIEGQPVSQFILQDRR